MTDNTQELYEILEDLVRDSQEDVSDFKLNSLPREILAENRAKLAILDWNNKQMSELLDRLAIEVRASDYIGIAETIQSERNKLTMANSPQLDKLKEINKMSNNPNLEKLTYDCDWCEGEGTYPMDEKPCEYCNGTGVELEEQTNE